MNRKILGLLFLTMFFLGTTSFFAAPPQFVAADVPTPAGTGTILFITGYGMGTTLLSNLTEDLVALGYTVMNATTVNSSILATVDGLVMASPYGSEGIEGFNATNAPAVRTAIKTWFDTGSKFLWLSGDSDYAGDVWHNQNITAILQNIGSRLRLEMNSIEDPQSNCASAYRVAANETVSNTVADVINTGITDPILFHGPSCVYALDPSDTPVALENVTVPGVYPIIRTSLAGLIIEANPLVTSVVHKEGYTGSWVMMAAEQWAGPAGDNKIILSGASPYGDYQPMYTDVYYSVPLDGEAFVVQAIDWGMQVSTRPDPDAPTVFDYDVAVPFPVGDVELNWTATTDQKGFPVVSYDIEIATDDAFTDVIDSSTETTNVYTATFDAAGDYYIRVRATDDLSQDSAWSATETIRISAPAPPIPGFPIAAIAIGAAMALGVGFYYRRRKR
ncbi:MAG: hypothetical protein ACFFCF_03420 [Promethearchaeota archaeon]